MSTIEALEAQNDELNAALDRRSAHYREAAARIEALEAERDKWKNLAGERFHDTVKLEREWFVIKAERDLLNDAISELIASIEEPLVQFLEGRTPLDRNLRALNAARVALGKHKEDRDDD